jgi:hypothetical protein
MDRQIVHLGFKDSFCREMRSAAWGHITMDSLVDGLRGPEKNGVRPPPSRPTPLQGQMASAFEDAEKPSRTRRRRRRRRPTQDVPSAGDSAAPAVS